SSRRRHTRSKRDWSSDVCSSDLGENLSNLIPFDQPCGWNVVAATPLKVCDYTKEDPFLAHAGDWVKYQPVSRKEYDQIKADVERGTYKVETYAKKAVK